MSVELSDPLLPSLWSSPMVGDPMDICLTVTRTAVQKYIPSVSWRQRGRVVRASDLKSVGRGFKSRSDR